MGSGKCHGPCVALSTLPRHPGFYSLSCATAAMGTDATSHLLGSPASGTVRAANQEGPGAGSRGQRHPSSRAHTQPRGKQGSEREAGRDPSPASTASEGRRSASQPETEQSGKEKERTGAKRDSSLGAAAARPDPCTRRAFSPRGRGCRAAPARLRRGPARPAQTPPPRRQLKSEAPAASPRPPPAPLPPYRAPGGLRDGRGRQLPPAL